MTNEIDLLKSIMSTSVPLVALSVPILGFLLSQVIVNRDLDTARPYRTLTILFTGFLLMGTFVSVLSFLILAQWIPASLSLFVYGLFMTMLVAIPVIIAVTAVRELIR